MQTLEDRPPGVEGGVGVAATADFVLTIVRRGNDLAGHDDPRCEHSPCGGAVTWVAARTDVGHVPDFTAVRERRVDEPIAVRFRVGHVDGIEPVLRLRAHHLPRISGPPKGARDWL